MEVIVSSIVYKLRETTNNKTLEDNGRTGIAFIDTLILYNYKLAILYLYNLFM